MFVMEVAGVRVRVENKYSYIERLAQAYIVSGTSYDFSVSASEEEIAYEQSFGENSPGYCESFCLYRQVCEKIAYYNVFFMHSAVVEVDGRAYAFTAQSGVGKSTHISLWLKNIPGARVLNGDKPLFRVEEDGGITACGTPWNGKENWGENRKAPLVGICFVERGEDNQIRRAGEFELLPRLMEQLYMRGERSSVDRRLMLLDAMLGRIPLYVLQCTVSDEAARLSYETMSAAAEDEKEKEHHENQ